MNHARTGTRAVRLDDGAKNQLTIVRRHWTEAEARGALVACEASGLSMRAFALREGVRPRRLYRWTKRLGESKRSDTAALRFVPAVVKVDAPRAEQRAPVTVRVGAKATLEIAEPMAVSARWVADVMVEMERIACS